MKTYQIENTMSAVILGLFEAKDEDGALEAFAREVGYASYAECCEVAPAEDGEILVTEVETYSVASARADCQRMVDEAEAMDD